MKENILLFLALTPKIYEMIRATQCRLLTSRELQQRGDNKGNKFHTTASRVVLAWMLRHHINSQASSLQLQEPPGPSEVFRANPKGISSSHCWIASEDTVPLNKPVKVPQNPIGMYACRKNDANSRIARHQKAKVMPPSAQMFSSQSEENIVTATSPRNKCTCPQVYCRFDCTKRPLKAHRLVSRT